MRLLNRLRNKIVQNCQEELYRKIANMSFDQKYGDLSSKESFEKKFDILVPIPFSSEYLDGIFINLHANEINSDKFSGIVLSIPISYECHIVDSSIVAK